MSEMIAVSKIDTAGRLRHVRPERAAAMAESIAEHGQLQPVKVVTKDDGTYRLVFGEHRLVAVRDHLQRDEILATVKTEEEFGGEAKRQIEEIVENFVSFPLTVLEEAVALATWKDLYEAQENVAKHGGRRRRKRDGDQTDNLSVCFTDVAAEQLGCSDRNIRRALTIARGISDFVRDRVRDHAIADHQGELLALAAEPEARQEKIAGVLLSEPPQAKTVAEAIAVLDRVPTPRVLRPYERLSQKFAALPEKEQKAFFSAHRDSFEAWLAEAR